MSTAPAHAKINLALVVGPLRSDGKHEVVTVLQRLELADRLTLEPAAKTVVTGFADDTLARTALDRLSAEVVGDPGWVLHIEKAIPVGAGLGGGSSDAATALRLANATLEAPLPLEGLTMLARGLGADVPFFLHDGSQLGTGDGSDLTPLAVPQDYWVVLVWPSEEVKSSTAAVYRRFDERQGSKGFGTRRAALVRDAARVRKPVDLALLPTNDLASSPVAGDLCALGAFRADVSGAGPVVYALFLDEPEARTAEQKARVHGRTWLTRPA
jgi:4-diphosphocytidyl-2-C-methyl-D-erythritol kinase